jgi:CRP-like cAMP-binding protein
MNREFKKLFKGQVTKNLPKGDILIYEADQVKRIYYILDGYIKVYTVVNTGVQRIIYIYKPGDVLPLTTYLSGSHIARFFYECLTPATIRCMSIKKFDEKVLGNYELGEALVQYTTSIDRQFLRRVNDMVSNGDNLSKLMSLLNFLYQKFGADKSLPTINLPLTTKDIASMSGLNQEETINLLRRFESRGVNFSASGLIIDKRAFRAKN